MCVVADAALVLISYRLRKVNISHMIASTFATSARLIALCKLSVIKVNERRLCMQYINLSIGIISAKEFNMRR